MRAPDWSWNAIDNLQEPGGYWLKVGGGVS
jgi:hypothetical protein